MFEVRYTDLAARIGRLETPHGVVETPAFVPVVHPVRQTISPQFLKDMGFGLVITNAYITLKQYGDEARRRGIHDIIGFDGVVMTDSGGYQVLEYGSVEVEPATMAQFEKDIKSDIPIPLDKPTGYGLPYERAKEYVDITLENSKETLRVVGDTDAVWVGPVQGAEHFDLVEKSAMALDGMGFQFMALGSPVELMEAYEFATLARMIARAKKAVPSKPIHLFGAGHPLTIPVAIALGCDTFDSASYMLYAKDDRYMHPGGTVRLGELAYLPCQCAVCVSYTADELRALPKERRMLEVAKHNLHVLKAEVDATKQAIMDGRLWEYVMQKARAHPKLMEAVQLFASDEFGYLAEGTAAFKEKAIFFFDAIDQHRPEARRYRRLTSEFRSQKKTLMLFPEGEVHPFYSTRGFRELVKKFPGAQLATYNPFLGVIPAEISDVFPASHNVTARVERDSSNYPTFVESLKSFTANNNFDEIITVADAFMKQAMAEAKLNARVEDYSDHVIERL
ncbi:tRNA guanosine(15) transglycosylase TgtA [Nitrososphaera sp.]|uniref:tRNA guanosine(15) transglycosylase TgtA n=1 Tax=Nitrososphaera sp. TaxID=1971748 RepID=UPI002EDB33A7